MTFDQDEEDAFLALCERHKVKMTDPEIYFRRRKNSLKLAAMIWISQTDKSKVRNAYKRFRLMERKNKIVDHLMLIDKVWNHLNPDRRYASDSMKWVEIVWAVDAVKDGSFDEVVDNTHRFE